MSLSLKLLFLAAFIFVMILMGMNHQKKKKSVYFIGDSITEFGTRPGGFIALFKEELRSVLTDDNIDLINAGKSGNTIVDIDDRLNEILIQDPKVSVLFVGVNDIWHKEKGGGTDLQTFTATYEKVVQRLLGVHTKLIICTPAIIGENEADNIERWNDLETYGNAIKQVAHAYDIPVVDLYTAFRNYYKAQGLAGVNEGILTTDGVHLSTAGNKLVAEETWKILKHFI